MYKTDTVHDSNTETHVIYRNALI